MVVPSVLAVLPAVQAPLVEVAALVVDPLEVAVAEAAQEEVADSDAIDRVYGLQFMVYSL